MLEAMPDFDPHDLKHEGAKTQRSTHVNEPYVFQKFPQLVHKDGKSIVVNDQEALDKALSDGYSEDAVPTAVETLPAPEPVHVVIDEFPKSLYKDGGVRTVNNADEFNAAKSEGFSETA